MFPLPADSVNFLKQTLQAPVLLQGLQLSLQRCEIRKQLVLGMKAREPRILLSGFLVPGHAVLLLLNNLLLTFIWNRITTAKPPAAAKDSKPCAAEASRAMRSCKLHAWPSSSTHLLHAPRVSQSHRTVTTGWSVYMTPFWSSNSLPPELKKVLTMYRCAQRCNAQQAETMSFQIGASCSHNLRQDGLEVVG